MILEVFWLKLEELVKTLFAVNRHHVTSSKYRSLCRGHEKYYISQKAPGRAVPLAVAQVTADAPSCDNISTGLNENKLACGGARLFTL